MNVQKENRDISPTGKIIHGERSVNISEKENAAKPVKNMASRAFASGQTANRRNKSHTPDNAQKPENAVSEHIGISPETAQRMKRAAFLDQQNKANIKINTARTDYSETLSENSEEKYSETVSEKVTSDKKAFEPAHISQPAESSIGEMKKTITPEMALRMKRAAFIEQINNEAIRLNREAVVKDEDIPQADEKAGQSETVPDVPVEHLKDEQGKA